MSDRIKNCINFLLCNLALRFMPTAIGVAVIKRMPWFDLRLAWNNERLDFIYRKDLSEKQKIKRVHLYYGFTPKGFGIAWACGMESAFRLAALMDLSVEIKSKLDKWLIYEYDFLSKNIEWNSRNNHLLVCLVVAHAYNKKNNNDDFFCCYLKQEIQKQFNPDGSSFEGAAGYHLLTFSALLWLKKQNHVSEDMFDGFNFLAAMQLSKLIMEPKSWALIGDNDSSILGDKNSFFSEIKDYNLREGSYYYPDFSVVFKKGKDYVFGLWGAAFERLGHAGHKHDDWGAVTFAFDGDPLLVDVGVYTYSWDRGLSRSRLVHNVVSVPDLAFIDYEANFRGKSDFRSVTTLDGNSGKICVLKNSIEIISRKVFWKEAEIKAHDAVYGYGYGYLTWVVNACAWDVEVIGKQIGLVFISKRTGKKIKMNFFGEVFFLDLSECYWHPEYGKKLGAKRIFLKFKNEFSWSLDF